MTVVAEGPGVEGPVTIVLVHGVGLDHAMWAPVSRLLARDHRVVRYDLLGHGTAAPLDDDADLATFARQLLEVVDSSGVDRFVLVGFSLGALIAQRFALDHPERVDALVLVSSVFDRSPADRGAVLDRVQAVRDGEYAASIEPAIERWFSPAFAIAHPADVEAVRRRLLANDVVSYATAYSMFATADAALATLAAQIAVPTLVVTGGDDLRSTPAMTTALAAAIPDAEATIVPGVRHLAPLEAPAAIAAIIGEFLAATLGTTGTSPRPAEPRLAEREHA